MVPAPEARDAAAAGPSVGPLARAAELELRVRDEALRRERAETRAERAEALAEVATARVALLEARIAAAGEERDAVEREHERRAADVRRGLRGVVHELDALRALAVAAAVLDPAVVHAATGGASPDRAVVGGAPDGGASGPASSAGPVPGPAGALRGRTALDPTLRMGELARGARELLAGGRLEAADEVIRGLEDAAERLRAQAPPASGDR